MVYQYRYFQELEYAAGFIEFIVEPSMGVCADMLEAVLAPILGSSAKEGAAKDAIEEEPACKCTVQCSAVQCSAVGARRQ